MSNLHRKQKINTAFSDGSGTLSTGGSGGLPPADTRELFKPNGYNRVFHFSQCWDDGELSPSSPKTACIVVLDLKQNSVDIAIGDILSHGIMPARHYMAEIVDHLYTNGLSEAYCNPEKINIYSHIPKGMPITLGAKPLPLKESFFAKMNIIALNSTKTTRFLQHNNPVAFECETPIALQGGNLEQGMMIHPDQLHDEINTAHHELSRITPLPFKLTNPELEPVF